MTEQLDIYALILNIVLLVFVSSVLVYIILMNLNLPIFIHIMCFFEILINIFNIYSCFNRLKLNNY
ncbi:hypothetical protein KQ41_06280 [Lysinibacillus fusiformis]|nr:hypothetical protein KQ41_06280 [Lysinibacillus fusiformis]